MVKWQDRWWHQHDFTTPLLAVRREKLQLLFVCFCCFYLFVFFSLSHVLDQRDLTIASRAENWCERAKLTISGCFFASWWRQQSTKRCMYWALHSFLELKLARKKKNVFDKHTQKKKPPKTLLSTLLRSTPFLSLHDHDAKMPRIPSNAVALHVYLTPPPLSITLPLCPFKCFQTPRKQAHTISAQLTPRLQGATATEAPRPHSPPRRVPSFPAATSQTDSCEAERNSRRCYSDSGPRSRTAQPGNTSERKGSLKVVPFHISYATTQGAQEGVISAQKA